ncbi:hypothetical protein D7Z26_05620 [Cohnella endophytica]|uniref:Uncharacterized protein n=1 Tax=Cohnella endophytica TaxID=2419778 RepID=A0A494Y737_9BACL|nr:hypothetical protein [Cohnella endophytica]RKP56128.1 hypothetical protein D7Z26_05620 [Cohnella endophytica]
MDFNFNDTDAWIQFAKDHWVTVAIAIVAIIVIVKVVKTVLKWVLVVAILIGIVVYGGYSVDDIQKKVTDELGIIGEKVSSEVKDQAIKAMAGEASEATYVDNADGSYSIKSTNLELTGIPNSGEVNVKFHNASLGKWKMEGAVRDYVVKARASAK